MRRETITVKIGDELLTVSTNEIAACLSAIRPNTIENNLQNEKEIIKCI